MQSQTAHYSPSVVGIDKFHYASNDDAYNLFSEQPRFLLDNLGTREFVVRRVQQA
jgi:hypothetical protein